MDQLKLSNRPRRCVRTGPVLGSFSKRTLFLDQLKLSNRPRNVFRMGPVLGSVLKFEPNECEKIFENIMINNHKYNLIEVR